MELLALIFSGVSALAAIISAIAAFLAKSEVKKLKIQIYGNNERGISGKNRVKIENTTTNTGSISGINTGDINVRAKE